MSSKKELKELRKLAELNRDSSEKKQNTIKWLAISIASLVFLIFFIGLVVNLKKQDSEAELAPVKISDTGWTRGATESAKVTLTEFSDLQCPACAGAEPYIQDILSTHKDSVKFVYKHFPLPIHKNSTNAAKAAEAAGVQGKFWEMHDVLFDKQNEWENENNPTEKFAGYAKDLKLDVEKFKKDMDSQDLLKKINKDEDEAIKLGVNSTPTFYLNNKKVDLANFDQLKTKVEEELKK